MTEYRPLSNEDPRMIGGNELQRIFATHHNTRRTFRNIRRRQFAKRRPALFRAVKERDKVCLNCGAEDNLTIDHIIAVADFGSDDLENLRLLCNKCQAILHGHIDGEWALEEEQ